MFQMPPTITYHPVESYKFYNYALLHTRGLDFLFDTLRYDNAFLPRRADVDRIIAASNDYMKRHMDRFTLLLAKYDFKGATKPNWTPARLLSTQEFEYIKDPMQLFALSGDSGIEPKFRPNQALKFQAECPVEGTFAEIMEIMFANNAMPANEGESGKIQSAMEHHPNDKHKVLLRNYVQNDKTPWRFPPIK